MFAGVDGRLLPCAVRPAGNKTAGLVYKSRRRTVGRSLFFFLSCAYVAFLLDAGLLARQVAQIVNPRTANDAHLVHFDAVDVRGVEREDTLHAYAVGYFADGKHFRDAAALYLDDHTAETLDTLLVSFHDSVGYGDGIAALERGYLFLGPHRVLRDFDKIVHE